QLDSGFREDVHAADLRRHAKLRALFFYSDDRRLAAHPALFAGREFGRKDQDQLDVSSLFHARLGIEEDSVGADVAGLGGVIRTVRITHARGNASSDAGSGAAFGVSFHVGEVPTYCTPRAGI